METVKNKLNFMQIKNQTKDSADIYFYGDIVSSEWGAWESGDTYPEMVRDYLKEVENKNRLNIYINSPGGSVFAGLAIYNMLKRHKAEKTVYVDGVAASIASVIAMAGDRVIIPSNAFLMVHKPWTIAIGNADDFLKAAEDLEAIETGIMNVYEENMAEGVELETIQEMVAEETWLNGREAAKYFNVEVGEENNIAACVDSDFLKNYKNVPDNLPSDEGGGDDETLKLKMQNELDLLTL